MLPKLYRITHPSTPHLVVYVDPAGRKVRRHFSVLKEAEEYHRGLLRKAQVAGTAGLVLDAEMRAEYFAARRALDGVPIMTAVRYYLAHRPVGLGATLLADALAAFLGDMRRKGRAARTIASLKSTLEAFLAVVSVKLASDYTRDAITGYLDALECSPLTIRNHRARLSAFGEWLARRRYIPENPARYIESAHYDLTQPRVLTPEEAERVMRKATEYRGGIFAAMYAIALFAGLRHGEILRLTWEDICLDGPSPIIRVGRGKLRGRRSVRVVPIQPALVSWLRWVKVQNLPLVHTGNSAAVRESVEWQPDICRHSWISYWLAMILDELRVAREAGNSPDVIYRHYFQLVTRRAALRYLSIWAPA